MVTEDTRDKDATCAPAVPVRDLHHIAWRCHSEEARSLHEDLLSLPLVHVIQSDIVLSTGEACPHVHIVFQMAEGSYLAFFDLGDDVSAAPSPNTPAWVNHLALRVDPVAELTAAKSRLKPADHLVAQEDSAQRPAKGSAAALLAQK